MTCRAGLDSANGVSVRKIVDWLRVEYPSVIVGRTKKHVMQWTVNNVLKILRNRLYTGYMEMAANGWKRATEPGSGKWIQTHEVIISPALFDQVAQGLIARKRGPNGRGPPKRLAADLVEARTNAVRLVVKGVISVSSMRSGSLGALGLG